MKKKSRWHVWSLVFILLFLTPFPSRALAKSKVPSPAPVEKSKAQITVLPTRQEVKILRAERRKQMPYLDRGFVKETIQAKTVQAAEEFTQKPNKVLSDLVERAVQVDPSAKAAKEKISYAKRRIFAAVRDLLPAGEFGFDLSNGSLSADAYTSRKYNVKFTVPIFRGGVLWNTLLKEKADFLASQKEYDGKVNELVDEVSRAYFELIRSRAVYQDRRQVAEMSKKYRDISNRKHVEGLISEIEYLNVDSLAGQIDYDVETAKQELELAQLELGRYLDLNRLDELELAPLYDIDAMIEKKASPDAAGYDSEGRAPVTLAKSLDEFVELAYQHRPELQVEAYQLRSARLEEKIKFGEFLPQVDLTMEFGEKGEAFVRNADDPPHFPEWHLGLEVNQNLFGNKVEYNFKNDENPPSVSQFQQGTGSQTTSRAVKLGFLDGLAEYVELKDAKVKKLEQIAALEKKEQEVIREVKEAYYDFQKAQIQVASSIKRYQYREKLVKLAQVRLEKAEIEISEFLQSEIDRAEERSKLHRALSDFFKARSKLNRAIGIRDFVPIGERYEF